MVQKGKETVNYKEIFITHCSTEESDEEPVQFTSDPRARP